MCLKCFVYDFESPMLHKKPESPSWWFRFFVCRMCFALLPNTDSSRVGGKPSTTAGGGNLVGGFLNRKGVSSPVWSRDF